MNIYQFLVTAVSYIIKPQKRKLIQYSYKLKNKAGIEVGGPSSFFALKSFFPVYLFATKIDGVNYSNETVWEGSIKDGENYNYTENKIGRQFIYEATSLKNIPNNSYDFLLSCHSLEHIANPIKALNEWSRVLKTGGTLVLVLPDKNFTFDHNRPYTTFEHLKNDFEKNVNEHDPTHFEEIYKLHDITLDTGVNNPEELKKRTEDNFINRCVHHHVYSLELLDKLAGFCNFKTLYTQQAPPFHLVLIAKKIH